MGLGKGSGGMEGWGLAVSAVPFPLLSLNPGIFLLSGGSQKRPLLFFGTIVGGLHLFLSRAPRRRYQTSVHSVHFLTPLLPSSAWISYIYWNSPASDFGVSATDGQVKKTAILRA